MKGLFTIVGVALSVVLGPLPAAASQPPPALVAPAVHPSDPAVGPHALLEAQQPHDLLHFAPARSKPAPRAVSAAPLAGPAAFAGGTASLTKEVLDFVPPASLAADEQAGWNYSLVSTLAYFSIDLNYDGSFAQTGDGWNGYNSANFVDMVNRAHAAHDRVVLVIKSFNDATINGIVNVQANTDRAIANTIDAITAKNLDGVNVDFEGQTDPKYPDLQSGLTHFMTQLSSNVHQKFPNAMVSIDTYSGSASWDGGFFKIGDLAPVVDALFIMAYDMYFSNMNQSQAGPNAPLTGWTYNDTLSVQQYLSKAPASKIILGTPYYGIKWSTTNAAPYASATSGAAPVAYSDILGDLGCAQGLIRRWDATAQSPWATWFSPAKNDPCGGNYNSTRELYYDDATSLGLKYDLVNANSLLGTGAWNINYQDASNNLVRMIQAKFAPGSATFYFAEGFTGAGFGETLYLLMPNQSGTATIDYYLKTSHLTQAVPLTIGQTAPVSVNDAVGPGQDVSIRVSFPGQGIAERRLTFNTATWHGTTEKTGVTQPNTDWYFAEGSTLNAYSEYLSLANPNATDVAATLAYQTDGGAHPVKTVLLKANTRATVEVMSGDLSNNANCTAGAGGSCGVGRGIGGVSVQVKAAQPIIAERPMYVNSFNFGAGPIRDGHDAFGVNAPATRWYFAEGTTLDGFNEYLTLQNPGLSTATANLRYVDTAGQQTQKTITINPQTRVTVPVFGSALGVGRGVSGVAVQVDSNQPIVAERPMYMFHDFGSGPVAGAHDVVGATSASYITEFARASTIAGENDYLTIANPGSSVAHLEITYWSTQTVVTVLEVGANSRQTVPVNNSAAGGIGPGQSILHLMVVADQPVVVERPSYSTNAANYGATDTMGFMPASF